MTFGEQIRDARKGRGWSQEELARRASVSLRTITRVELGEVDVTLPTLIKLARELPGEHLSFSDSKWEIVLTVRRRK
jgi:transcriptional regulator with XRE-family HTH domain